MTKLGIHRGYVSGTSAERFPCHNYKVPLEHVSRLLSLDEPSVSQPARSAECRVDYEVTIDTALVPGFVEVIIKLCAGKHTTSKNDMILVNAQLSREILDHHERALEAIARLIDAVLLV